MRLGSKKRICFRSNRVNKRKCSAFLCLLFFVVLLLASGLYFLKIMRPIMIELASSKAEYLAVEMINAAVSEIFSTEPIKTSDIVRMEKDADGKIRAVQSDLASVNRLKSDIALGIQQKIAALSEADLSIPMGSLSGHDALAGIGPYLRVSLMPYGNTRAEFTSSFEEAGVNQTRLSVHLKVTTSLALLMPTANTTCTVEDTVPVFETIVVGETPESFFHVNRADDALIDDAMEFAP